MLSMRQHVSDLLSIITSPQIPAENLTKDVAAIHLKNYLVTTLGAMSKKAKAGSQTITAADLSQAGQLLAQALLGPGITDSRRPHLQLSLEVVLFTSQSGGP